METCYVLFGSNMGDREEIFDQSCLLINYRCGHVVQVSSAYESEPWGFEADQWFLNRVIVVDTDLAPEEMLRQLLDIEAQLGRVRHPDAVGRAQYHRGHKIQGCIGEKICVIAVKSALDRTEDRQRTNAENKTSGHNPLPETPALIFPFCERFNPLIQL
jgi:hypothetical protein